MKHLFSLLVVLIGFVPVCFSQSACEDGYCIDSIMMFQHIHPREALDRIDSLRHRCEADGWKECRESHLEAVAASIYRDLADYSNVLRCGFKSLNSGTSDDKEDCEWHLTSLQLISNQYVRSQNWLLAAKYIYEMETLAQNSPHKYYYLSQSCLSQSIMFLRQYNVSDALRLLDSIPYLMVEDCEVGFESRRFEISCKVRQYRSMVYGLSGNYDYCFQELELLESMLYSSDSAYLDRGVYNQLLLYCFAYSSYLCTFSDRMSLANDYYERAIVVRSHILSGERCTRLLASYLFAAKRFDDLDTLLLPMLNSPFDKNTILYEQDHLMKLYIRSLYQRKRYVEAASWMERYFDTTALLFQENGKRSMNEFQYAYKAEEQKLVALKQHNRLIRYRFYIIGLIVVTLFLLGYVVFVVLVLRKKRQDNRFLFGKISELNSARERLTLLLKDLRETKQVDTLALQSEYNLVSIQQVVSYLNDGNRFLDKELTVDSVLSATSLSYDTLNKRLNLAFGMGFNDYLICLRLEYACQLLLSSNRTIEAVADESGFNTTRTFQRQFKEKYNLTPSMFRECNSHN